VSQTLSHLCELEAPRLSTRGLSNGPALSLLAVSLSNPSNRSTAVRLVAGGADPGLPAESLAPSGPASARPATTQALFLEIVAARPAFAQGYGVAGVPRRQGRPQRGRLQRLIPFVFFPEKIGSSGFSARLAFDVSVRQFRWLCTREVLQESRNRLGVALFGSPGIVSQSYLAS